MLYCHHMFDLSSPPEALEKPPAEPLDLFDEAPLPDSVQAIPLEAAPISIPPTPEPSAPMVPESSPPATLIESAELSPLIESVSPSPETPPQAVEEVLPDQSLLDTAPHVEEIMFDSTRDEPEIQKMVRDTLGASETNEVLQAVLVRVLMQVSLTVQPAELLQQLQKATESFFQTSEDGFFLEAVCTRLVQAFRTTYQRS